MKDDDLVNTIKYAHQIGKKVYVTINTILDDNELIQAKQLIDNLYEIKVDAIIIQDFGLLYLSAKNILAPIPIHMSTQCDIRNLEKENEYLRDFIHYIHNEELYERFRKEAHIEEDEMGFDFYTL